ncbi:hypothetical protein RHGRI_018217 [Rhododendron griersonianum]|uniref:Uncharacterized protein n=1 Tax=Rhododendron griersonianum TaxID=479676 RepID=A0AAV6K0T3_9ERIC|nr:hypothetical protein RHGRI_018217 [Rhododendron griersonianum]
MMLKNFKKVSSSSLSSQDICNRNSLLIKQARKFMDIGASVGIKYYGSERYNIKKYIEMKMEKVEFSDKELDGIVDGLDEDASIDLRGVLISFFGSFWVFVCCFLCYWVAVCVLMRLLGLLSGSGFALSGFAWCCWSEVVCCCCCLLLFFLVLRFLFSL